MRHRDYVAQREAKDEKFRAAREELRPQYEFRRALIGARIAAGLTRKQLADRLSTTQSAIARLESGAQMPTLDTLYRLAVVLGIDFTITPKEPITARPHEAA
ncbi:MAG: helix-turn-helix transcriptional regulator [Chloroflexi bacterium]|nr:helix-turn-helix transcriptional regulator [Chloroflexota bacterium]